QIDIFQHRTRAHVMRIASRLSRIGNLEILNAEMRNRFDPVELIAPEFRNAAGAGEAPGHSDDGNAFHRRGFSFTIGHGRPLRARSRWRARAARCFCARCWASDSADSADLSPPR